MKFFQHLQNNVFRCAWIGTWKTFGKAKDLLSKICSVFWDSLQARVLSSFSVISSVWFSAPSFSYLVGDFRPAQEYFSGSCPYCEETWEGAMGIKPSACWPVLSKSGLFVRFRCIWWGVAWEGGWCQQIIQFWCSTTCIHNLKKNYYLGIIV